ncbi:MAG TPA: alpha/beta fold hydrolase [Propionibacteriaceae bacterium]
MRTSANGGISPIGLLRLVTLDMPRVASGLAIEAAWATAHMVMYPLGLLSASTRTADGRRPQNPSGLTPEQRGLVHHDVDAAETPILLVHGIIDNHAIFTVMERALRRRGFQTLSAYDYGLLTRDIPRSAVRLGDAIENLCAATGYERIHVIGHSLGGLIARYYVQRLAGDRHVHTLVTLGTPHQGTQLAWAAPLLPLVGQLTPSSSVIQELAEPAPGCRTRFVAFYSDIDHLIVPSRNARLGHPDLNVRNIAVRGVGHLSMPNNGRIAFTISNALRQLDHDGASPPHNA